MIKDDVAEYFKAKVAVSQPDDLSRNILILVKTDNIRLLECWQRYGESDFNADPCDGFPSLPGFYNVEGRLTRDWEFEDITFSEIEEK